MAAPVPTPRQIPTGFKMPDGFKTLYTFALKPAIQLWEMTVKPPGLDGGEPIPTTTMHNIAYRTFAHKHLKTLIPVNMNCMYDPDVWPDLLAAINRDDTITCTHPDGSTTAFYGFLQKAEPGENKEGDPPTMAVTIAVTNWDAANNVEAAPVFTAAAST